MPLSTVIIMTKKNENNYWFVNFQTKTKFQPQCVNWIFKYPCTK